MMASRCTTTLKMFSYPPPFIKYLPNFLDSKNTLRFARFFISFLKSVFLRFLSSSSMLWLFTHVNFTAELRYSTTTSCCLFPLLRIK